MKRRHQKKRFRFLQYMQGVKSVEEKVYRDFKGSIVATIKYMRANRDAGYLQSDGQATILSQKGLKFIDLMTKKHKNALRA